MRQVQVFYNEELAGLLTEETHNSFLFHYDENYFNNGTKSAISLTLPKTQQEHQSNFLFPVFSNILSEGANRKIQSLMLHIDEKDDFGILIGTAQHDTIGPITVKPLYTN